VLHIHTLIIKQNKQTMENLTNFLQSAMATLGAFLPTLVGALVIFIIGYIIAKILRGIVSKVLTKANVQKITNEVGIEPMLKKSNASTVGIVSGLIYWVIMLFTLLAVFSKLGLTAVSDMLNKGIALIPNIIVALVLVVIGLFVGNLVRDMVQKALAASGNKSGALLGDVARGFVLFIVFSMALAQIGIGGGIIESVVQIVLGAIGLGMGLALGIAFGIGGQEKAKAFLNKYM
jgi:hypothetical protein